MANKKRAAWGSKKRAAEQAAAEQAATDSEAATALASNGVDTRPNVGEAIENVKNWLAPFDAPTRKSILKAVGVFLK